MKKFKKKKKEEEEEMSRVARKLDLQRTEKSRVEKFRGETRNLVGKREILAGPWKQALKWDDVEQSKYRFQVYTILYTLSSSSVEESSVDGFLLKLLYNLFSSLSFFTNFSLRKNIFRY